MANSIGRTTLSEPISAAQRQAIFAAMKARGLAIDDVRALCPNRSISKLSKFEAGNVLSRLNSATEFEHPRKRVYGPRRPKGVYRLATDAQRRMIEYLRIKLGWTPEGLTAWLSERHHDDGRPMTRMDSSSDAASVIELLKSVDVRTEQGKRTRAARARQES